MFGNALQGIALRRHSDDQTHETSKVGAKSAGVDFNPPLVKGIKNLLRVIAHLDQATENAWPLCNTKEVNPQ